MFNLFSSPILTNVTVSRNSADQGGGMFDYSSNPTIKNAIFWGNTNGQIADRGGSITITYSLIQGYDGPEPTNINTDPKFAGIDSGDLRLQTGSPARDTGTNAPYQEGGAAFGITTDLDGNHRIENE